MDRSVSSAISSVALASVVRSTNEVYMERHASHIKLFLLVSEAHGILLLADDSRSAVQLVMPCCVSAALQLRQGLIRHKSYVDHPVFHISFLGQCHRISRAHSRIVR